MGLSPELQGYAENIWRRFPAEFISLGSPDLEDFFELSGGGRWCHRVVDAKSEKVIEIVLPRRVLPRSTSHDGPDDTYEDEDELEETCDDASVGASREAALKEIDLLDEAVVQNFGRIRQRVEREVSRQFQALQHQRSPEPSEDEMALSHGSSPRSSLTFDSRIVSHRVEDLGLGQEALDRIVSHRIEDPFFLGQEALDEGAAVSSLGDRFRSISRSSFAAFASPPTMARSGPAPGGSQHISPNRVALSSTSFISPLAGRRDFVIHSVVTHGLRKVEHGSVYRAPQFDRMANGELTSQTGTHGADSELEPMSPFEQAWTSRSIPSATSCSPPDAKSGRRHFSSTHNNTVVAVASSMQHSMQPEDEEKRRSGRPQGQMLNSQETEFEPPVRSLAKGYDDSSGARIQHAAHKHPADDHRQINMEASRSCADARDCPRRSGSNVQTRGYGFSDGSDGQEALSSSWADTPVMPRAPPVSEPSSPMKKRR